MTLGYILLELESAALLRLTSRRPHVLRVHSGCSHQPRLAANPIASSIYTLCASVFGSYDAVIFCQVSSHRL